MYMCLRAQHAQLAFEETGCVHCEHSRARVALQLRALEKDISGSRPHGSGPASVEAER